MNLRDGHNSITEPPLEVIVIGGGHAGLSISYCLKKNELQHIVFERGRIGESWISQRWDSFVMNTANKVNTLPGESYSGDEPNRFCSAVDFVKSLNEYKSKHQLPVVEQTEVLSVMKSKDAKYFMVDVSERGSLKTYQAKQVVVASGCQNEKRIPSFANNIASRIFQLHTSEYRSASNLPEGSIVVIGGGQSGCQIAEELVEGGRRVYLSTSMVARIPRRYRGKDIIDWLTLVGFYNLPTENVRDLNVLGMTVPLLSGIGTFGHTLSYQLLSKKGVIILGKMENADADNLYFSTNASDHIKFADHFSQQVKEMVDDFIFKNKMTAPAPEIDIADLPDPEITCASSITQLGLNTNDITTIIWATGFNGNYNFLRIPLKFGSDGDPMHKNGVSDIPGLYFLGLPWLRMRKSSLILGINDDSAFIADAVAKNSLL